MKGSHRPGIGLVLVFLLLYVVYTFAPALLYNMAEKKRARFLLRKVRPFRLPVRKQKARLLSRRKACCQIF